MASLNDLASEYGLGTPEGGAAPVTGYQVPGRLRAQLATPAIPAEHGPEQIMALMQKYSGEQGGSYGRELAEARQRATQETQAFQSLLDRAVASSTENAPSRAELYFRLASAFGTPGRTGNFFENLGQAGAVAADFEKQSREAASAAREKRLQLGLTAQQQKMTAAKDDLATLRQLTAEEMKDKRAIASKLLEEYVKSGQAQSTAGKQAADEGLKIGTPEYQKRVKEIGDLLVEKQMGAIQAQLAGISLQQANLALSQGKFQIQQANATKLTPGEVKLKVETEDLIGAADSALSALKQAYKLNPNTYDNSAVDMAQRKLLELGGSKDPKLLATREMENLLSEKALSSLKATFGGNPTEGERKILLDLQAIGAKSVEERRAIMLNAARALQVAKDRQQKRLNEINAGLYRDTGAPSPAGGLE